MTLPKTAGRRLVSRIVKDMGANGLEPDGKERELLTLAEGLADQLEKLREVVASEGYTTVIGTGRIVAHPCVALANQTTTALARVLAQIRMDDGPSVNLVKQRASKTRWRAHNAAKAQQYAAGGA